MDGRLSAPLRVVLYHQVELGAMPSLNEGLTIVMRPHLYALVRVAYGEEARGLLLAHP
ncbi:MAG: hypothetical protein SGPRY_014916, partial [Prymnesium sp.]